MVVGYVGRFKVTQPLLLVPSPPSKHYFQNIQLLFFPYHTLLRVSPFFSKGAGSFHIHGKTMKDLWALAVLGV